MTKKARASRLKLAWFAPCAFACAAYALLLISARWFPVPLLPVVIEWLAYGTPLALLLFMLVKAGQRRYDGVWALAGITMLVGFLAENLFRLSANLDFVPSFIFSTVSPAGLIMALIWTGWLSLRARKCGTKATGKIARVMTAVLALASIVPAYLLVVQAGSGLLYALILYVLAALVLAGNALLSRSLSFPLVLPFVFVALSCLYPLLAHSSFAAWFPVSAHHAFTMSASVLMLVSLLSVEEAVS